MVLFEESDVIVHTETVSSTAPEKQKSDYFNIVIVCVNYWIVRSGKPAPMLFGSEVTSELPTAPIELIAESYNNLCTVDDLVS